MCCQGHAAVPSAGSRQKAVLASLFSRGQVHHRRTSEMMNPLLYKGTFYSKSHLTSDSVALAGASLGAWLGAALGAGLGAGGAGAGGAATAGPLQRALDDGLRPPQVRVAAGAQREPSAEATRASGPPQTDRQLHSKKTPLLLGKAGLKSSP